MQPPAYSRQYDFASFSATNPSDQQPGVNLDAEFNALKTTIDAALANLALIQRDDGGVKNNTIGLDQLTSDVLVVLGGDFVVRGPWVTTRVYAQGDVVSQGIPASTYVAAVAHTSGVFATDLAAGKWVLLFGSVVASVADGAITTPKLADGSVTFAKVGFTTLDLTGTLRGQGGVAGGTAAAGTYPVAGKKDAGDAFTSIARATRAQGKAGLRVDGGATGAVWELAQQSTSDNLTLYNSLGAVTSAVFYTTGLADLSSCFRVTGAGSPASGSGIETFFNAGAGYVQGYDRTGGAYLPLYMRGSTVFTVAGGITVASASSSGVDFLEASIGGLSVGYRDLPQNVQSGNYTFALQDRGKHVYSANSGATAYTIPLNASAAFPIGTAVLMVNNGTTAISVSPAGGVTLNLAGTALTGARTLAQKGVATILKVAADTWFISGSGVS
jgi:hypothetical protein